MTLVVNWVMGTRSKSLKRLHPRCEWCFRGESLYYLIHARTQVTLHTRHSSYPGMTLSAIRTKSTYLLILSFLLSGRKHPREPLLRSLEELTHSRSGLAPFPPCTLRLFFGSYRGFIETTIIRKVLFFFFFFLSFVSFGLINPWPLACQ